MKVWLVGFIVSMCGVVWCDVLARPIEITDSHGKLTFLKSPKRVVLINWTLTEQVIELGIIPVGVADKAGYEQTVVRPPLVAAILDVGSREAPDLKKIKVLKPDVIIIGYSQRPLIRVLSNLAPVVYFNNFSKRDNNEVRSRKQFLMLAQLFDKTDFARQKLKSRDEKLAQLKKKLQMHYDEHRQEPLPKVTVVLAHSDQFAWAFGKNSMPVYALEALGLHSAMTLSTSQYGVAKVPVSKLQRLDGCVLYISDEAFDPLASAVWQNFTAVKEACFFRLSSVSAYGGVMSVQYLAEAVVGLLL